MGAAVPLPFISGKALSPCVLLDVEGFRVEEPFPLQLSDEESSARKDVWSPPWHLTATFPKLLWAHLVAELPQGATLALDRGMQQMEIQMLVSKPARPLSQGSIPLSLIAHQVLPCPMPEPPIPLQVTVPMPPPSAMVPGLE